MIIQETSRACTAGATDLIRTLAMLIRISVLFLLCFVMAPTRIQAEKQQPNILFILTDQWRAQSIGYTGNEQVKTPNIDELARSSVNFKNAVSGCPVCCPLFH